MVKKWRCVVYRAVTVRRLKNECTKLMKASHVLPSAHISTWMTKVNELSRFRQKRSKIPTFSSLVVVWLSLWGFWGYLHQYKLSCKQVDRNCSLELCECCHLYDKSEDKFFEISVSFWNVDLVTIRCPVRNGLNHSDRKLCNALPDFLV